MTDKENIWKIYFKTTYLKVKYIDEPAPTTALLRANIIIRGMRL